MNYLAMQTGAQVADTSHLLADQCHECVSCCALSRLVGKYHEFRVSALSLCSKNFLQQAGCPAFMNDV